MAELSAMVLDGDLAQIYGETFRSVVTQDSPVVRAAALAAQIPAALAGRVAFGWLSAAWIYGCAPPPQIITLLASRSRRCTALPAGSGCVLHEVKLSPYELTQVGGIMVTGALRTAMDVASNELASVAVPVLDAISAAPSLGCPLGRIRAALETPTHQKGRTNALALVKAMLSAG
ncbi:hypothetical protein GCM10025779_04950 [Arthrobacter cryoconiti]